MTIITVVNRDRAWTADEDKTLDDANTAAISAGTTTGTQAFSQSAPNLFPVTVIRIWTTEVAANQYIAILNSFTPPPPSAVVTTV